VRLQILRLKLSVRSRNRWEAMIRPLVEGRGDRPFKAEVHVCAICRSGPHGAAGPLPPSSRCKSVGKFIRVQAGRRPHRFGATPLAVAAREQTL